jgi:KDO2-lipid IV(A) lauroyltransferase
MARLAKGTPKARFFHSFRYRIGEYALRGSMALLPRIPRRCVTFFTLVMGRFSWVLLSQYRRRMEANFENALGDRIADPQERKALLRRAWNNFALGVLDTVAVMHMAKERVAAFIALEGEEHLKQALAKGKGVIALSAHLGAFTLIGPRLAAAGYSFSVVVKHPNDERFARVMTDYRAQIGVNTISAKPRQEAVRGILQALRKNGIVLVIADEFKSGGVQVSFMGQQAAAPRGPASLALRTGAATLPMFAPRTPDGSVQLQIGPEIELVRHEDVDASVGATTRLFTSHIEAAVRRFPDQWNWLGFRRTDRVSRAKYWSRLRKAKKAPAKAATGAPEPTISHAGGARSNSSNRSNSPSR